MCEGPCDDVIKCAYKALCAVTQCGTNPSMHALTECGCWIQLLSVTTSRLHAQLTCGQETAFKQAVESFSLALVGGIGPGILKGRYGSVGVGRETRVESFSLALVGGIHRSWYSEAKGTKANEVEGEAYASGLQDIVHPKHQRL